MVLEDLLAMGEYLTDAGAVDPVSAILLVIGHVLLLFSLGAFGVLTAGAILAVLQPD